MPRTNRPLYQGDEDGFCGLYSVINSLRLLWPAEINDKITSAVFREIAHSLDCWPSVIWNGTNHHDMRVMLGAAQRWLAEIDLHFTWKQPFKRGSINHIEVFETNLRHELDCLGTVAILWTTTPTIHWTVARRFTRQYMLITDSGMPGATCTRRQISFAECGLWSNKTRTSAFVFDYPYTFVVRRDA